LKAILNSRAIADPDDKHQSCPAMREVIAAAGQ